VPGALLSYQTTESVRYDRVTYFSLRNVVGVCGALFVLALIFLIAAEGPEAGAVLDAFWSQSFAAKLAWAIVVLIPLVLVPAAVWLGQTLVLQRQAAQALELRLDGVRQGVRSLVGTQVEAEVAAQHLARTDPEDAMGAMRERLAEAERVARIQDGRNQIGDLSSRVEEIRALQQALQKRLGPVLERRRSIEQMVSDLDSRQTDIDHTLAEIASGDDAVALDNSLKKMTEFVRRGNERCDEIERASKVIAGLQQDYAELQKRLVPLAEAEDGVARRLKELNGVREQLAGEIESIEQTPQGPLGARVQKFSDDKKLLDDRVSQLNAQFSKLATLRKDVDGLFAGFDRALDMVSGAAEEEEVDIDARVEELATFIEATQAHLDEIERRAVAFAQLKTKLGELQVRLNPLEAGDGGVVSLIGELRQMRDRLVANIRHIENDEDGSLAERVKKFSDTRRELEDRVTSLAEQFSKLATIRKDIAGLSEKLSGAVNSSAN
jgi:chromosome segregation ATPase